MSKITDLDSVSKRLKYLVDTLGVKQSHMAQKLGMSPSGLHYILNNEVKFSKNAKKIAEYLNVSEDWLVNGQGEVHTENTTIKTYKIPLYYPDQLKLYYSSHMKMKIGTNDFILTTNTYAHKTIAVYLTEATFAPKFEIGDIITFECTKDFKDGDFVLIYSVEENEVLLKNAYLFEDQILLISTNARLKKINLQNGDILIGCYRECLKKYH